MNVFERHRDIEEGTAILDRIEFQMSYQALERVVLSGIRLQQTATHFCQHLPDGEVRLHVINYRQRVEQRSRLVARPAGRTPDDDRNVARVLMQTNIQPRQEGRID